jgi:hypothetical protein
MQGFRSWSALQRFVSTFSAVSNHFVPPVPIAPLCPRIFIAAGRCRNGNPSPPPPEM